MESGLNLMKMDTDERGLTQIFFCHWPLELIALKGKF